jgi:hypothetical protein
MESKPYDVVLLPEERLMAGAITLSNDLEKLSTYFTLGYETYLPHLSLYMLQLNENGLKKAISLLPIIAKETDAIEAITADYHYESNYIDVEYVKSKELVVLQEKIIDKLNPIRDGLREKDKIRLVDAVGETRKNIINYGYRSVGNLFNPHLTFTRFKDNQEHTLKSLPVKESFDGKYTVLGIFELGDNGTCVRKIQTWDL